MKLLDYSRRILNLEFRLGFKPGLMVRIQVSVSNKWPGGSFGRWVGAVNVMTNGHGMQSPAVDKTAANHTLSSSLPRPKRHKTLP